MAFDGFVMAAVVAELKHHLIEGKINRIYQPSEDTLLLHIRQNKTNKKLLLSSHAVYARVCLTDQERENPAAPPMFCMVLRKHLEGGRIVGVEQPPWERLLRLRVLSYDELGRWQEKVLVCEVMGKHSNIILIDQETNLIHDGIKRYSNALSRHREVLPGRPYIDPPAQAKLDPAQLDEEQFFHTVLTRSLADQLVKVIAEHIAGFSPLLARETIVSAGLPQDLIVDHCGQLELRLVWQKILEYATAALERRFNPTMVGDFQSPVAYAAFDLIQYEGLNKISFPSISQAIDAYYGGKMAAEKKAQVRNHLNSVLIKEIKRLEKKLELQQEDLRQAGNADELRLKGELLTTYMYQIPSRQAEVELENYYQPEGPLIKIALNLQLTPAENAQWYYKKYAKAKNAAVQALEQITKSRMEAQYLDSLLFAVEQATEVADLAAIQQEMEKTGLIRNRAQKTGQQKIFKEEISKPWEVESQDGLTIMVGRNNLQNEYLSLKLARNSDFWFHAKDVPGSHVVVRSEKPELPPDTLFLAAMLAAYFSKAKNSANVPVDYTMAKHVRKLKGGKPGMVIYDHHKTLFVTPDAEIIKKLGIRS
jgi:predicted ribosome quality control (RQC) complex YloA/Tae2 family protein